MRTLLSFLAISISASAQPACRGDLSKIDFRFSRVVSTDPETIRVQAASGSCAETVRLRFIRGVEILRTGDHLRNWHERLERRPLTLVQPVRAGSEVVAGVQPGNPLPEPEATPTRKKGAK